MILGIINYGYLDDDKTHKILVDLPEDMPEDDQNALGNILSSLVFNPQKRQTKFSMSDVMYMVQEILFNFMRHRFDTGQTTKSYDFECGVVEVKKYRIKLSYSNG